MNRRFNRHSCMGAFTLGIAMIATSQAHAIVISDLSSSVSPNPDRSFPGAVTWSASATLTNDYSKPIFIEDIFWALFELDRFEGSAYDENIAIKWFPIPAIPEIPVGGIRTISTGPVSVSRSQWILGYEGSGDPDAAKTSGLNFATGLTVTWRPADDRDDKHEDSQLETPEPASVLIWGTAALLAYGGARFAIRNPKKHGI